MKLNKFFNKLSGLLIVLLMVVICNSSNCFAGGKIQRITQGNMEEIQKVLNPNILLTREWKMDKEVYSQLGEAFKYSSFPAEDPVYGYDYSGFMQNMYFLPEVPESKIVLVLKDFSKFSKTSGIITKEILLGEFKSMIKFWDQGGITKKNKKDIIIYYT